VGKTRKTLYGRITYHKKCGSVVHPKQLFCPSRKETIMDRTGVTKKGFSEFLVLWFLVLILFVLTGCTVHITKNISKKLDQDALYGAFNVNPNDLSLSSKCNAPPTVKIINIENRIEDYGVLQSLPFIAVINPKEMMDSVCLYLKNGFEKSLIKGDDQSSKVIQVKMDSLKIENVKTFGSSFKIELIIPETSFTKFYEAKDKPKNGYDSSAYAASAYAIHSVTRQIIEDPIIQDYILCR
jgi:predicted nucleic acid-binding Zn ribbon protein